MSGTAANYLAGKLLQGTAGTYQFNHFTSQCPVQISSTTATGIQFAGFSNDIYGNALILTKSRGATVATNTIVQNGDTLGGIQFCAADGTNYLLAATIQAQVDGAPALNDMPTRLTFSTTLDGASSPTERLRIDNAGNILNISSGGLGYGTGSGGAVTQGTSRTTGVTLDKTNGAITLFSAAGSATYQSFTVTNNKVAATDVINVCQKSGTDLYEIQVTAVAAGSFRITYRTTGGTTTEQPVFNFAVIKAVTA
jgi:hypothetical protein